MQIGRIGVPLRISKNRIVESLLQMSTNLAHNEKFTTGDPMYVFHSGVLLDTVPLTLENGPAAVDVKLFCTCNDLFVNQNVLRKPNNQSRSPYLNLEIVVNF